MKRILLFTLFTISIIYSYANAWETNYFVTYGKVIYYAKEYSKIQGDSLVFANDSITTFVPIDSLATYQYKTGTKSGTGFLFGAIGGAAIGALAGASADVQGSQTGYIALTGILGAALGGITGALIGHSLPVVTTVDLTKYKGEEKRKLIIGLMDEHVVEH